MPYSEAANEASNDLPSSTPPSPTPLPKFQLLLALLIQASESMTGKVIYPFMTEAVRNTGITRGDEKRTGYVYLALSQMLASAL